MTSTNHDPTGYPIPWDDVTVDIDFPDPTAAIYNTTRPMNCPNCGEACSRDQADVGIGIMYGPWGCYCGWSEDDEYNRLAAGHQPITETGHLKDPWGGLTPIRQGDRVLFVGDDGTTTAATVTTEPVTEDGMTRFEAATRDLNRMIADWYQRPGGKAR